MKWLIKIMSKSNKNKRGFTLIELMVVVIVVGILAAAAIPIYRFAMSRAYSSEAKATMGTMMTSMKVFAAETADGQYPATVLNITSNEITPGTDAMSILGVDTTTNTWWYAGYDSAGAVVAGTSCSFGTTGAAIWPAASGIADPAGVQDGPFVWAIGNVSGEPIYNIKLVYAMGSDEWFTSF